MKKAPVNNIIPLSTVDGPGCRSSIFLQGCNMHCAYCHNPETIKLCQNCGDCVSQCPAKALSLTQGLVIWNEKACIQCGTCIAVCPHFSSPKVKLLSAAEVMAQLQPNLRFIRGITVSGGECTLYPQFLTDLFTQAKAAGLHCLLDSNGSLDFKTVPSLLASCDGVMLDIKAWDSKTHQKLTDVDNVIIKNNLFFLAQQHKLEEIRIVCIEGEMDAQAAIYGIAQVLPQSELRTIRLKLIAFRPDGVRGRLANKPATPAELMQVYKKQAQDAGFCNIMVL